MRKKNIKLVGRPAQDKLVQQTSARDLILSAYFEINRREGMEKVTLQKIADESGLALNTVRYHFNMQGLTLSQVALDYVSDRNYQFLDLGMLKARAQENFDPVEAYLNLTFEWISQQPIQASFLVYYYYLSTTQVELSIHNKELVEIAQQRISGLIYEGVGMKIYDIKTSVDKLKRQIHMMIMGASMIMITSRDDSFAAEHRAECLESCNLLLGKMNIKV